MTCDKCTEIYCPHRDEIARCYYENFAIPNDTKEFILQEPKTTISSVIKEITKDKESATKFLKSAGIITDDGGLHPRYK